MKILLILLTFLSCDVSPFSVQNFYKLKQPIIVVAKSDSIHKSIVLRDSAGTVYSSHGGYYHAKAIWNSYTIGDTLK